MSIALVAGIALLSDQLRRLEGAGGRECAPAAIQRGVEGGGVGPAELAAHHRLQERAAARAALADNPVKPLEQVGGQGDHHLRRLCHEVSIARSYTARPVVVLSRDALASTRRSMHDKHPA